MGIIIPKIKKARKKRFILNCIFCKANALIEPNKAIPAIAQKVTIKLFIK